MRGCALGGVYKRVFGRARSCGRVQARVALGAGGVHRDVPGRVGVVDVIEGDIVPLARDVDGFVRFEGAGVTWAYGGPDGGPARENDAGGTGDTGEEGRGRRVVHGLSD